MLLWFDPNNPVLSNWLAFTQEFSSKFGIFDTIAEAEENLFNLQMHDNKCFTTFIVRFEREAYKTGWNYNALQFALHRALPQRIKDVLRLAPKQTTYDGYKALVTQVDQHYWEDHSENMHPPAQLNAANLHDTPVPLDTNPNNCNDILDPADNQEALCANRIQDSPWINVLEETQEKRRKEGMCILC
ncbi:hypothetical protein C0989_010160, partial [Termitomyces sp. Mn162]